MASSGLAASTPIARKAMQWRQREPPAAGTSPWRRRCVGSRLRNPISSSSCECSIPAAISWDRRSRSMAERTLGLVGVGGYVPRYRLSGRTLAQVWGGGASGERAVANYDEDALTMATEAALDAMAGRESSRIDACFFASTSAPYVEKSNATLLATVVDLPIAVLTADITGSLRSGTTALRLALDTVAAGSAREALVAAGDMRPVAPGGELEALLGDGAGAALVGSEGVIAAFAGAFTVSHEFTD